MSPLVRVEETAEPPPEARVFCTLLLDGGESLARDPEVPARASAVRLLEPRRDQPFLLEPAQRDEDRRLGDGTAGALLEREHEWDAVRLVAMTDHREEHLQLEMLEHWYQP